MLNPLALAGAVGFAVEPVHRQIERLVRLAQVWRHEIGVVKVCQSAARTSRTACASLDISRENVHIAHAKTPRFPNCHRMVRVAANRQSRE